MLILMLKKIYLVPRSDILKVKFFVFSNLIKDARLYAKKLVGDAGVSESWIFFGGGGAKDIIFPISHSFPLQQ